MKKNDIYHRVLKNLQDEGYAECKDIDVQSWLGLSKVYENRRIEISNALTNDLKWSVIAIFPTGNPRDHTVRFFTAKDYNLSTGKRTDFSPQPPRTVSTLPAGRAARRAANAQGVNQDRGRAVFP